MVARGDLGIEIPAEDVPLVQKKLIAKARKVGKPVIVATQMLDSMIRNPRPTRAEVSDVANAVIDHTDAVMLSGETANGKYPIQTVKIMAKIIKKTEASRYDDVNIIDLDYSQDKAEALSGIAAVLAKNTDAQAILVTTLTGRTANLVSRNRPELPIFSAVSKEKVYHQLSITWGVEPFLLKKCKDMSDLLAKALSYLKDKKQIKKGSDLIFVSGRPLGVSGKINFIELKKVD
jgi:pyruvate kinase